MRAFRKNNRFSKHTLRATLDYVYIYIYVLYTHNNKLTFHRRICIPGALPARERKKKRIRAGPAFRRNNGVNLNEGDE